MVSDRHSWGPGEKRIATPRATKYKRRSPAEPGRTAFFSLPCREGRKASRASSGTPQFDRHSGRILAWRIRRPLQSEHGDRRGRPLIPFLPNSGPSRHTGRQSFDCRPVNTYPYGFAGGVVGLAGGVVGVVGLAGGVVGVVGLPGGVVGVIGLAGGVAGVVGLDVGRCCSVIFFTPFFFNTESTRNGRPSGRP